MANLVDTSILARLANVADPFHAIAANAVMELHRGGEVLYVTARTSLSSATMPLDQRR